MIEESRSFYHLVLSVLHQPTISAVTELESAWKKQRLKFIDLLKHQPKSLTDRQTVQNSSKKATSNLPGPASTAATSVSSRIGSNEEPDVIEEALILSDLFNLNEIEALKLIKAGELESWNQFQWPRGLCAVYLFYKNRWYQAQTLKVLMRNRQGRLWRLESRAGKDDGSTQLHALLEDITEELWKEGLLTKLLGIFRTSDDVVQAEFNKLLQPAVKGLGDVRHRSMISECIEETYAALGDSLYYWCCQSPLEKGEFSSLLRFASENAGKTARLAVVFSILQAIDVSILEISDSTEVIRKYAPFAFSRDLLLAYNTEIFGRGDIYKWADVGAQSVILLAWAVTIRMIAQNALTQEIFDEDWWSQDEEEIVNSAMQLTTGDIPLLKSDIRGPFHWLRAHIMNALEFQSDELYQRRLHSLITQLVVSFPLKVKDWRGEADEECRHLSELTASGAPIISPPYLHFEQLMLMIGEFYGSPNPAKLNFSEIYFHPSTQEPGTPFRRIPQSQIALFKFLRFSGEMLPSRLYVAYLRMLSGLASNANGARQCFEMLKSFATLGASLSAVSLDNFFIALERYLGILRMVPSTNSNASPHILPDEMKGLQTWLDLIISMIQQDDSIRLAFFEHPRWSCPANLLGLVTCAVPMELKGRALRCLSALAQSPELALELAEGLFSSGIVSSQEHKLGGVQQELEEVESRSETYPITNGLIGLLASLCQHKSFVPDGPTMRPYLNFVFNSVFVHLMNRNYKSPVELWELATSIFKLFCNILDNYDPTVASIVRTSIGCQVMVNFMTDGPVFRTLCRILVAAIKCFDEYGNNPDEYKVMREATLSLLKLLYLILWKQDRFSTLVIESGVPLQTTPVDVLLQLLNPQTGRTDYITILAMLLIHYYRLPEHCLYVIRIINSLNFSVSAQSKIVKYFLLNPDIAPRILRGFVYCLSLDGIEASFSTEVESNSEAAIRGQTAFAVLELLIADIIAGGSTTSLSNFLLGFNLRSPKDSNLENPGVGATTRTCLHAVLDITDAALGQDLETLSFGMLVEPAYRLLYWLCALPSTSEPMLRYLRGRIYEGQQRRKEPYGFIYEHIRKFVVHDYDLESGNETETNEGLFANREISGWLLRLCALELNFIRNTQPNYITALTKLLMTVDDGSYVPPNTTLPFGSPVPTFLATEKRPVVGRERRTKRSRRLLEFLTALKPITMKDIGAVDVPKLRHFEGVKLSKVVAACTIKTPKGYYKCDITKLCGILEQELLALQSSGVVAQLHLVSSEIEHVVDTLKKYNDVQQSVYVLRHAFAGFAQTTEVLFGGDFLKWMEDEQRDQAIIETVIETLRSNLTAAAADSVANLLLNLTTILRRRFNSDQKVEERALNVSGIRYGGSLDGAVAMTRKAAVSCAGILATALKLLIEATLKTDLGGASKDSKSFEPTIRERMAEEHWAIVNRYAGDLVDTLAKDAADGPETTKTLAMCCLVTFLEQDAMHGGSARKAFKSRGYQNAIAFPPQFQKWISMIIT